jgi:8-oxo-dGTP diphosphatase
LSEVYLIILPKGAKTMINKNMAKQGKYVYEWPRAMVTVDAAVFSYSGGKAQILLIKRGNEPFEGMWALPGGFIEMDEELEAAAARELAEETGLCNVELEQMRTYGTCGRDPRGRLITIVFLGIVKEGGEEIKAGDDAAQAKWFDAQELPEELAFDHGEIIAFARSELEKKRLDRER